MIYSDNAIKEKLDAVIDAIGNIAIDADSVNLNTDGLEAKLDNLISKDFATQTTLALIKAKTDNLDTALSGVKTGTDKIIAAPSTAAKQDTGNTSLSSIDGKITACNTGAIVVSSGTITANAGTNLNTSLLALETGGNLATIAAKDFATQATLALIKAKTDNIDTLLSTKAATGDIAHDSPDSGNPVKTGGKAYSFDGTAPGTAVAEGDRANFITDPEGRQYVETTHPNYWSVSADYGSAQSNTSIKATPGVGLKLYITDIIISNGATAGNITLLDGSGGTVKFEIYPAINGGVAISLRTPIALTANTALVITSTTVTTHSVNISGFIAP